MLTNLELFKLRAQHANNDRQHDRMIKDKLRSFHRALLYSYQAAWIKKDNDPNADWCRALINPDKIKFDYDEKIVSVDWDYGFKSGDTFEWPKDSQIHWIILKQELTELAYFRGNVRRCQEIEATDPDTQEKFKIWASIRGPVETKLNTIQKAGLVADVPNLTLDIYMPLNEQNLKTFKRYSRFSFGGIHWKVVAYDSISTPGILEVNALEDYDCDHDELFVEVVNPNPTIQEQDKIITGEVFIYPQSWEIYTAPENVIGEWKVSLTAENNKEVEDVLDWEIEGNTIKVFWDAMVSGSFKLQFGDLEKTIVVQSLF